mmetsp:Transcript_56245/g.180564  ORF Transcript_56245/g.180564 Transcript_56245/m.180564 type:complete len:101 (-) Transcript_56245:90-392(-)
MSGICGHLKQLEVFCNGCRNECDQKCVIDNHEVEILQGPIIDTPHLIDSCCPSGRAADFCTPRSRSQYTGEAAPAGYGARFASGLGLSSERSHRGPRSAR